MEKDRKEQVEGASSNWNQLLPYARQFLDGLTQSADATQTLEQEALLLSRLRTLQDEVKTAQTAIQKLLSDFGSTENEIIPIEPEQFGQLAKSRDAADFYRMVSQYYASPEDFERGLDRLSQMGELATHTDDLRLARSYLEATTLKDEDSDMAVDRDSLLNQITPAELIYNPGLAIGLLALFQWFRAKYGNAYIAHHEQHHRQLSEMHKRLEQQRSEVDAIKRLNSITELGEVLGQDLAGRHQHLLEATQPCLTLDPAVLDDEPVCPKCHLKSTDKPPSQAHDRFTEDLNSTLEAQQRRLSAEAIRQILARSEDDRIIRFLQIVQAADLSSLVNVLDDSLVDFLRQSLSETHISAQNAVYLRQVAEPAVPYEPDFTFSPDPTVLRQLMDSFDTVGDEEVELVAKELAKLLHKALDEEKSRQPSRRVRIRLR